MKNIVIYVHGKGGSAQEAEHYGTLFPDAEVVGFDYRAQTPWECKGGIFAVCRAARALRQSCACGNSIGAYFSMCASAETLIDRAYFISPIVDMEKLICKMMAWAGVTEQESAEKSKFPLSLAKRCRGTIFAMCGSIRCDWGVPTCIL